MPEPPRNDLTPGVGRDVSVYAKDFAVPGCSVISTPVVTGPLSVCVVVVGTDRSITVGELVVLGVADGMQIAK